MLRLRGLKPEKVFKYFEDICSIPHGSENMIAISNYCIEFAKQYSLRYYTDSANNVVIYKEATAGYENAPPVILQGHLDMVCQKVEGCNIDFLKDGLDFYTDGDYIKARGTTLGADNGIAVAMILAILESNEFSHPAIEAVFTTDEEIGMIGAKDLDMTVLSAKRMINLDSEEDDTMTVSCAGGSDFKVTIPIKCVPKTGRKAKLSLKGLRGGHSGVEIGSGRVNSNILTGRILNYLACVTDFDIISIYGGDKGNAITKTTVAELCVYNELEFNQVLSSYIEILKKELIGREAGFCVEISFPENEEQIYNVYSPELKTDIIYVLTCVPNGVVEMSADIKGLVETSLNLGILKSLDTELFLHFTLRSNKISALEALEKRLITFFSKVNCCIETFGHYPPWEYKNDSALQKLYISTYTQVCGKAPKVEAIHAGLECGVFSSKIENLDCIAIGPQLYGVHTTDERLGIKSTEQTFNILEKLLENLK